MIQGTWPEDCKQRAFVDGAAWWQFHVNDSTMFGSERDKAEKEAVSRYGEPEKPRPILERIAAAQLTVDALVAEIRQEYKPAKTEYERISEDVQKHGMKFWYYQDVEALLNGNTLDANEAFIEKASVLIKHGVIVRKDGAQ